MVSASCTLLQNHCFQSTVMGYSSWLVDHWNNTIAKWAFLSEDVIFSTDFFRNELSWNR